ncbi:MAG TPA: hypothetical protein VF133_02495 [Terriglobales bacterium]
MRNRQARIPVSLKIGWTLFVVVWAPVYWKQYGAQNFLFYCDIGNLLILAGLWIESRLLISWQSVGLLVFQFLYAVDLLGASISGHHVIGGTEYMFDAAIPFFVRLLGLYHLVVLLLLLGCVRRLGYDRNAWKWQVAELWVLLPINFSWRPGYNVNFARGIAHEQHLIPAWLYLVAYMVVVPLLVYWPTHRFLQWWAERAKESSVDGASEQH